MRTTQEILAFVNEQIWYTEKEMQDRGSKSPLLAKVNIEPGQDSLEEKYWLYTTLKGFIEGTI